MKIWTVVNGKGGVGKTTLCTNLACTAAQSGEKVMILDLDPTKNAKKWWGRGDCRNPIVAECNPLKIRSFIERIKEKGITHLFLDTAGKTSELHLDALEIADLCIVPVQPSPADLDVVFDVIKHIKSVTDRFLFVVSRCPAVGQDFKEAQTILKNFGPVSNQYMTERKAYKWAYGHGKDVTTLAADETLKRDRDAIMKASKEIKAIYKWILQKEERTQDAII